MHHQLGNVNRSLFFKLLLPGVIGAILGIFVLTHVDGNIIRPFIGVYLLIMGLIVVSKAFVLFPPKLVATHLIPLGLGGGFVDTIGGGGWGSIVTSTLLARGLHARVAIGSVNASEFFIATAVTISFFLNNVIIGGEVVIGLAIGGAIAAPIGALVCKYFPIKLLLFLVGLLIIGLSCRTLWMSLQ
jgi:uncharacterized membrane protein YfcA